MRTPAGFFMPNNPRHYEKLPLSIDQQILLLKSKGISISDTDHISDFLQYVSFFRLNRYLPKLIDDNDSNNEKSCGKAYSIDEIISTYIFDRKLRLLVLEAIEQIEIGVRTVISNEMALRYGAHWYMNKQYFIQSYNHSGFIKKILTEIKCFTKHDSKKHKDREAFINEYYQKYVTPKLPPIWMIAELLSFGTWSLLFANLNNREDQKVISQNFKLNYKVMTSWLHTLSYLRNLCAHHCCIWNRDFTLIPLVAKDYANNLTANKKFSAQAAVIQVFLKNMYSNNNWSNRLITLVNDHPFIDLKQMGLNSGWHNNRFWQS